VDYTPHQNGVGERLDWQSYLSCITKIVAPQAVFEIGTFRGQSALNFAVNSPADCTVYTLDLAPEIRERVAETLSAGDARLIRVNEVGIDYQGKQDARKIVQLWGDSRTFDFSPYYGGIDLVFIDGAHHYEAVINDTEQALKMVRPGGVIIWDNFSQYGDYNDVTRAVIERMGKTAIAQIEETELAIHRVSPTSVA
jgi:predicted O-methyltransferase YrrM